MKRKLNIRLAYRLSRGYFIESQPAEGGEWSPSTAYCTTIEAAVAIWSQSGFSTRHIALSPITTVTVAARDEEHGP